MNMRLYCNDTKQENVTWADVEAVLPEVKEEAFFRLTITPQPETGPVSLSVESEEGNYLVLLGTNDSPVRTIVNPTGTGKEDVPIGGYNYDPRLVIQDFDLVVRIIKEFYETGDVSKDILR